MEKTGCIISLGRKYGAGGREIGQLLADKLGIRYLDKELLRMVSEQSGIGESFFHVADERPGDNLLYRIVKNMTPKDGKPTVGSGLFNDENLFRFQSEVLRQVADTGESCIVVGRCADYILRDYPHLVTIFIHADQESRIARIIRRTAYKETEAQKVMKRIDKERRDYYHYYTGRTWGEMSQYDLCLDSGKLGAGKCAELIIDYIRLRGYLDS